jgi:replicative DNA helicase
MSKLSSGDLILSGGMPAPKVFSEAILEFDHHLGSLPPHRFQPVPTGFPWLDEVFSGGYHPANLFLLLGKQNVGKTTFLLQLLRHVAIWAKETRLPIIPLLLSYEHSNWDLFTRLLCIESWHIDPTGPLKYRAINQALLKIKSSSGEANRIFESKDQNAFLEALMTALPDVAVRAYMSIMGHASHFILYRASRQYSSVDEARKLVRLVQGEENARTCFLMVDYLQAMGIPDALLSSPLRGKESKDLIVGRNLQVLKDLTHEENIPIIAVSAIDVDALKDPRPIHIEDADGPEVVPYTVDGAIVINREIKSQPKGQGQESSHRYIRIGVEKNRNLGPSDHEHSHHVIGGSFFINTDGIQVSPEDSYQADRIRPAQDGGVGIVRG